MVYMILGTGFEETEAVVPVDLLRRAGVQTACVGIGGLEITGSHGMTFLADLTVEQMDLTELDMIVLPGGLDGVASIRSCRPVLDAIQFAYENHKYIGAICAAPTVLAEMHITDGKKAVCYPGEQLIHQMNASDFQPDAAVVRDGTVITAASAGCAVAFALELIAALKGRETAQAVADQLVIR